MSLIESHEPWLGEVPNDWTRSRMRNVATLSPGYSNTPPANDEECTIVPMEKVSDDGLIDVSDQQIYEGMQSGLTLFEEGDVLFAKITPCMENGKGAFVSHLPTRYAFGSTEYHVLRPRYEVSGKFLYYVTFNPLFRAYAAENMTGAVGQKRVSTRFLKDTRLYHPSVIEQNKIVNFLDISCVTIDAAIAAKQKQIETVETLRKATIQRIVTRGLQERTPLESTGNSWLQEVFH